MHRRLLATLLLAGTIGLAGVSCGGMDAPRGETETVSTAAPAEAGNNPFIPEDQNLSDCQSSLPRPGCGSDEQGGYQQLLTFGVLMLGMAFIGWQIAVGVRRRDRALAAQVDDETTRR